MKSKKWIIALGIGVLMAFSSPIAQASGPDTMPPNKPAINAISDKTVAITGKAESKAQVFAYAGSKKIGETTAVNGGFTLKIHKQKAGTRIKVFAMDTAKNKSVGVYATVSDKTAPVVPTVNPISTAATFIAGKAESNAKVYAYAGSRKLGETIAKNGVYKIGIAKQKAGTSISVHAVDSAKNKSASKIIKVVKPASTAKYVTTGNVNMRSGASTSFRVIAVLPKATAVEYIGKSGMWYKVKAGTRTGYVSSTYLEKAVSENPASYPAPAAKAPGTYVNGVLIVNKKYGLPSSYNPGVDATAQKGINALVEAAGKQGLYLNPFSAFRSYSRQETLYSNYVSKYGKEEAEKFSARPGHSEHQTGLAFDFGGSNQDQWLEESFGKTKEGLWLAENAHKYGFILRYPKGKETVTGYQYEPWHFRYVGTVVAAKLKANGMTLEEFLGVKGK